jgi:hypothetical protein
LSERIRGKRRWSKTRGTQEVFELESFALSIYLGTMRLASGSIDMKLRGTSGVPGRDVALQKRNWGKRRKRRRRRRRKRK